MSSLRDLPEPRTSLIPSEPFDALIFDCDGTLVDTFRVHRDAWRAAFADYGMIMSDHWYESRVSLSAEELIVAMSEREGVPLRPGDVHNRQLDLYLEELSAVAVNEPVVAVARKFQERVPLAVASSGARRPVMATLEAAGIVGLFDAITTAEDVRRTKPAPDLFLAAADALGVRAENCVAFEDSAGGIEAARAAGMRVVDVRAHG